MIFYDPRQSIQHLESYGPSAGKPARFVELAARQGFTNRHPVVPVSVADLHLVHSRDYVDGVFSGALLNGFENNDPRVPAACLWTIGSLLAAARHVLEAPLHPACSPSSGFHHACRSWGGGFCTFNGLMVVAAILVQENPDIRIAVLDCDHHYGDGTADILHHSQVLRHHVTHRTQGLAFERGDDPKAFQRWLTRRIEEINAYKPDVVLYQAGADPHIDDPLGGLLTDEQLALRDKTVFEGIKAGIAWNLAGGYQEGVDDTLEADPVLKIHLATLRAAEASISVRQKLLEPA